MGSDLNSLVPAEVGAQPHADERLSLDCIPEGLWAGWCRNINVSRLDRFPLGFYARSLHNLPPRLWNVRIGTYSRQSLRDVRWFGGHRQSDLVDVVKIVGELRRTLDRLPQESHTRVLIMPSAILDASTWISRALRASTCRTARAPSTALSGHCSSNWRSTFGRKSRKWWNGGLVSTGIPRRSLKLRMTSDLLRSVFDKKRRERFAYCAFAGRRGGICSTTSTTSFAGHTMRKSRRISFAERPIFSSASTSST